jgi:hypothetical protein
MVKYKSKIEEIVHRGLQCFGEDVRIEQCFKHMSIRRAFALFIAKGIPKIVTEHLCMSGFQSVELFGLMIKFMDMIKKPHLCKVQVIAIIVGPAWSWLSAQWPAALMVRRMRRSRGKGKGNVKGKDQVGPKAKAKGEGSQEQCQALGALKNLPQGLPGCHK